jgi:hypothetical protein
MRDAIGVQILEGIDNFGNIKNLDLFSQSVDVRFDEVDELPALAVLLHEVEIGLVLESVLQFVNPRMLHRGKQLLLHHRLVLLLLTLQLFLLDLLHRVNVIV